MRQQVYYYTRSGERGNGRSSESERRSLHKSGEERRQGWTRMEKKNQDGRWMGRLGGESVRVIHVVRLRGPSFGQDIREVLWRVTYRLRPRIPQETSVVQLHLVSLRLARRGVSVDRSPFTALSEFFLFQDCYSICNPPGAFRFACVCERLCLFFILICVSSRFFRPTEH